jgi:hypothetical protein
MMRTIRVRLLGTAILAAGVAAVAPATGAFGAAQNGTTHTTSFFFPIAGAHAPAACKALVSFPAAIASDDVNGFQHGTANKSGAWGGETHTGSATLYSLEPDGMTLGAPQHVGHVTEWDGGGQNSPSGTNQTEFGETSTSRGRASAIPRSRCRSTSTFTPRPTTPAIPTRQS